MSATAPYFANLDAKLATLPAGRHAAYIATQILNWQEYGRRLEAYARGGKGPRPFDGRLNAFDFAAVLARLGAMHVAAKAAAGVAQRAA